MKNTVEQTDLTALEEVAEVSADELQEMREFLNRLRESGTTNMFGAAVDLQEWFGLSKSVARNVLSFWMENFGK